MVLAENRVLRRIPGPQRKWQEVGEDCTMRSFITSTLNLPHYGDQLRGDEIGVACSTHRRDAKCTQYFGWKT